MFQSKCQSHPDRLLCLLLLSVWYLQLRLQVGSNGEGIFGAWGAARATELPLQLLGIGFSWRRNTIQVNYYTYVYHETKAPLWRATWPRSRCLGSKEKSLALQLGKSNQSTKLMCDSSRFPHFIKQLKSSSHTTHSNSSSHMLTSSPPPHLRLSHLAPVRWGS